MFYRPTRTEEKNEEEDCLLQYYSWLLAFWGGERIIPWSFNLKATKVTGCVTEIKLKTFKLSLLRQHWTCAHWKALTNTCYEVWKKGKKGFRDHFRKSVSDIRHHLSRTCNFPHTKYLCHQIFRHFISQLFAKAPSWYYRDTPPHATVMNQIKISILNIFNASEPPAPPPTHPKKNKKQNSFKNLSKI